MVSSTHSVCSIAQFLSLVDRENMLARVQQQWLGVNLDRLTGHSLCRNELLIVTLIANSRVQIAELCTDKNTNRHKIDSTSAYAPYENLSEKVVLKDLKS